MKPETQAELWRLISLWCGNHGLAQAKRMKACEVAINAILSRHVEQPAETEEQAALRELGEWLVAAPTEERGYRLLDFTDPKIKLIRMRGDTFSLKLTSAAPLFVNVHVDRKKTLAETIREALRLAKETP